MTTNPDSRTFSDLVSEGLHQGTALFRSEIELAKAEMAKKMSTAAVAIGLIVAGLAVSIATLVMALTTIAHVLTRAGLGPSVSFLLATLLGAALTVVLAVAGLQKLKAETVSPQRTLRQVQRDGQAVKGNVS